MYEQWLFDVIAYNGAVDHVFSVYRILNNGLRVMLDGDFYATAVSRRQAHDIIEQAIEDLKWTLMEGREQ